MTISSDMFLMSIPKGNRTIPFASKCWITWSLVTVVIPRDLSHTGHFSALTKLLKFRFGTKIQIMFITNDGFDKPQQVSPSSLLATIINVQGNTALTYLCLCLFYS